MRETENNNYKPNFQSFLNLLQKRKKLQRERLQKCKKLQRERLRKNLKEDIGSLPQAIPFPAYPSIKAVKKGEDTKYIGELAKKYLRKSFSKDQVDKTFGLYDKAGKFYIGNKLAIIVDNDLVVGKDEYEVLRTRRN